MTTLVFVVCVMHVCSNMVAMHTYRNNEIYVYIMAWTILMMIKMLCHVYIILDLYLLKSDILYTCPSMYEKSIIIVYIYILWR